MKTFVSKELCISCELCPDIAPDLYEMDEEDDKAIAIKDDDLSEEEVRLVRILFMSELGNK